MGFPFDLSLMGLKEFFVCVCFKLFMKVIFKFEASVLYALCSVSLAYLSPNCNVGVLLWFAHPSGLG